MVLIADGNTTRGQRLAEACRRAGVACKTGEHGAAALELALSEQPELVVAQLDLPLVDAPKLAEILRANPRTRRSRFLFLGDNPASGLGGPGDQQLPSDSDTDSIVRVIEEIVAGQHRLDAVERAAADGKIVEGELAMVGLAELIGLFQANRSSGRLELSCEDIEGEQAGPGWLWLRDGDVLQAEADRANGEKAFFRMLGWRQGRYCFTPGAVDEPAFISTSTRMLVQEGQRQLEEWQRLSTELPPLGARVRICLKTADLPNIVHPLTEEVLLLLELYSTVREVVDRCSFPDYQVLRTLKTLAEREIVELGRVPVPVAIERSADQEGFFDAAQISRLRDWALQGALLEGSMPPAKLLVAASDPGVLPDFARLLSGVAGVTLSDEMAAGKLGADDLGRIARVEIEEDLAIDLIHVPRDPGLAPLWRLAGQRALGSLFLLSGNVGEAAEALAPMVEALGELPGARTFHVLLLRKSERISPDELHDNLSLIDEASVFLLPLESRKNPVALLRALFSRVVP